MKTGFVLLSVFLVLARPIFAGDNPVWPFDKNTKIAELTVIYGVIPSEPSAATPEMLESGYSHSFTSKQTLGIDPLIQKLMEFIAIAKPIEPLEADFRWGIIIKAKSDLGQGFYSEQLFVAYLESKTIAKLGDHFFKLDSAKAKAFLSQFNGVFGCAIQ